VWVVGGGGGVSLGFPFFGQGQISLLWSLGYCQLVCANVCPFINKSPCLSPNTRKEDFSLVNLILVLVLISSFPFTLVSPPLHVLHLGSQIFPCPFFTNSLTVPLQNSLFLCSIFFPPPHNQRRRPPFVVCVYSSFLTCCQFVRPAYEPLSVALISYEGVPRSSHPLFP